MEGAKVSKVTITNVAVWGLGNHAINRILPALASIDEVKLVGVCSRNRRVVDECAKQWNCHGWISPSEMLNCDNVDVVYIATPIGVHFSLSEQALKAGKHVWCEKPLTCAYEETKFLVSLAEKVNKGLTEPLHHKSRPVISCCG